MQVTHVRDHVTHAVIGGKQAIDATISDSAEFFHILSSTLYTDQYLAVVREVLCNAWDAHIEAGCTDKAVQVTVNQDSIIVRDFGKGIHPDMIGAIYLTYGGSTKKANGQVTGGFGLGCKSPWAYVDNFEVTSHHAGHRTLYSMSKSSAEVAGKPAAIPIVSYPSMETGLEVVIPLKSAYDRHKFDTLFRRIAANGEMNVVLNGEQLKVLPFSQMKHGFAITTMPMIETHQRLLLRYGHVVYPIENHDGFRKDYDKIVKFLDRSKINHNTVLKLVVQAPPHSITVTPSREALSMQEHTISTIKGLLAAFVARFEAERTQETLQTISESVAYAWSLNEPDRLLSPDKKLILRVPTEADAKWIDDLAPTYRFAARNEYPSISGFWKRDILARLESLISSKAFDTDLLKSFRSEYLRTERKLVNRKFKNRYKGTTWLHRKVLAPLLADIQATKGMNVSKLMVNYDRNGYRSKHYDNPPMTEAIKFKRHDLMDVLPFTRNIIILAHSRTDVYDHAADAISGNSMALEEGSLIYLVPRNSTRLETIRTFFKDRCAQLVDLTKSEKAAKAHARKIELRATEEPAKPRIKGYPLLSSVISDTGGTSLATRLDDPKLNALIVRTETPEFVGKMTRTDGADLDDFGFTATWDIARLWGDRIALGVNAPQVAKMLGEGAKSATAFVVEQVVDAIRTNPRIRQYAAFDFTRMPYDYHDPSDVYRWIWSDESLRKKFGIIDKLTNEDKMLYRLWKHVSEGNYYRTYPEVTDAILEFNKIKLHDNVPNLRKHLKTCTLLDGLVLSSLRNTKGDQAERAKKILLLALQG